MAFGIGSLRESLRSFRSALALTS